MQIQSIFFQNWITLKNIIEKNQNTETFWSNKKQFCLFVCCLFTYLGQGFFHEEITYENKFCCFSRGRVINVLALIPLARRAVPTEIRFLEEQFYIILLLSLWLTKEFSMLTCLYHWSKNKTKEYSYSSSVLNLSFHWCDETPMLPIKTESKL